MLRSLLGGFLFVREWFFAEGTPRQIALAVAIGMMLGLVPKGNLTSASLLILLFALRVNLGFGLMAACLFSLFAPMLDPIADRLGRVALAAGAVQWIGAQLFALPLVPWTRLNNTVVLGQLLTALMLAYPVYRVALRIDGRLRPGIAERLERLRRRKRAADSVANAHPPSRKPLS